VRRALVCTAIACCAALGCGKSYDVKTAPGFVAIAQEQPPYDWRAVAPDGVAVAVRVVAEPEGADLAFWAHAVTLRMREMDGYALVSTADVRSRDGTAGKELVFGHDESGKPFVYRVRVYVAGKKLYVVEAGGAKEQMDRYAAGVDWMLATLKIN
jgi:hypothetical protein